MAVIHRTTKPTVGRGNLRVAWRYGRPVLLTSKGQSQIDYTPTQEDMTASDWRLIDAGNTGA